MPSDDSARLDRRMVHEGRIVRLSVDTVRFPDGSVGELELVRHRGASCVVPFLEDPTTAADPRVVMLRQYRYAAGGAMWEVPAGMPAFDGEDWDVCARRELEEETGYVPGTLRRLTEIHTTPGFTDEVIRIYAAWDLSEGSTGRDADEFMEVVALPWSEVEGLIEQGEITDAKTLVSLLYAGRFLLEPGRRG
ncbi:MAG: NUDIX hydrolase [Gemmatimonadota bacterium]|nr:NUDIX hydrolase [Gemmatimonadota bacterium]